ncbi:MAG: hypothetical protein GY875_20440 [Gammaproteobacteria bacterium]|nr:hypothetical protein [Gammaproteobacteria bacterium]
MKQNEISVYYTRCPVPTATGIALHKGIFDELFPGPNYDFLNIKVLGAEHADTHYTHSIDYFFREGGGSPPIWARAQGIENRLLGVTFMEELQGIFVRSDDCAEGVADLAGRRIALPVWPDAALHSRSGRTWCSISGALRLKKDFILLSRFMGWTRTTSYPSIS